MVSLTKIYTRGGDEGMTSLIGGARVSKHHPRMIAVGVVDETNAAIGLARVHTQSQPEEDAMLARIQQDLFDLGADLATPILDDSEKEAGCLRMIASQVTRLENEIDALNARLQPLESFVLPGGSPAAAALHMARVAARGAEREMVLLADNEALNPLALQYINRLSDHLFVLARIFNDEGRADILWQPGINR